MSRIESAVEEYGNIAKENAVSLRDISAKLQRLEIQDAAIDYHDVDCWFPLKTFEELQINYHCITTINEVI